MCVLHSLLTWISGCRAWHTNQPRPKLPPVPPSYSVQECTYVFRLVLGLGDQTYGWFTLLPPHSLLSRAVFLCPWEAAQSKVRTLLKCIRHCCVYEHQLLCGSVQGLLTWKGSDTWEGRGNVLTQKLLPSYTRISPRECTMRWLRSHAVNRKYTLRCTAATRIDLSELKSFSAWPRGWWSFKGDLWRVFQTLCPRTQCLNSRAVRRLPPLPSANV